jgi:hypothetical protein
MYEDQPICRLKAVVAKLILFSTNEELDPVRDLLQRDALTLPREELGSTKAMKEVSTPQKKASQSPIETARRVKQLPG